MAHLRIEPRVDRSLLLTDTGGGRWDVALLGFGAGVVLVAVVVAGGVTLLESVVALPLGLIVLLAAFGALRHRDWILFDRQARQVAYRRGLASIFRSVSALPFDDVEAIVVGRLGADREDVAVRLRCAGDVLWQVERSADSAYITRLVHAIHESGGWPVLREDAREHRHHRIEPAGSRG